MVNRRNSQLYKWYQIGHSTKYSYTQKWYNNNNTVYQCSSETKPSNCPSFWCSHSFIYRIHYYKRCKSNILFITSIIIMETITLLLSYPNSGRELRRFITALLKKWVATTIKRINYTKSFSLDEHWKIIKQEEKTLLITTTQGNLEKSISLIQTLHPHSKDVKILKIPA